MIDIHAHLHDSAFDADRDEVVARALDIGVTKIITIGTDVVESERAVACAEKYENVCASIGVHPDEIESPNANRQEMFSELRELARHSKIVAIGECGLDYYRHQLTINSQQKKIQKEGFLAQIELAKELQLPLIVHCRPSRGAMDAYEDLFSILSHPISGIQYPVSILHCYMGNTEVTRKFLELSNVYFSFTGNITYPVKKIFVGTTNDLTETVRMIPIERVLAETDCPYLAPQKYRGGRNEPAYVMAVTEKIAEIKGISREIVEQTVTASAENIFGL
jgi:TatD DNase family protein